MPTQVSDYELYTLHLGDTYYIPSMLGEWWLDFTETRVRHARK